MRILASITAALLFTFALGSAPGFAQEDRPDHAQEQPKDKNQDNKDAKEKDKNGAKQNDNGRQDENRRDTPKPESHQDNARPENARPENTRPENGRQENARPQEQTRPQEQSRPEDRRNNNMGQQEQARPENRGGNDQRAAAGGHRGERIPDQKFHASFGREHRFHVQREQIVNQAQPEFAYGGYTFELGQPWPSEWSYDDDYYVDYIDDDYYMYDLNHPGLRILVFVIGG